MFKISAKLDCSLRALILLGKNYGKEVFSLNKISEEEGVSKDFLAQLMLDLKKANIVESFKGISGGYILKRPPSEITLKEIFEAIEGPLSIIECIHTSEKICKIQNACAPKRAWEYIEKKILEILESFTLEDLIMGMEKNKEVILL